MTPDELQERQREAAQAAAAAGEQTHDETVEGGVYEVNGEQVNAAGEPVKGDPKTQAAGADAAAPEASREPGASGASAPRPSSASSKPGTPPQRGAPSPGGGAGAGERD